MCNKSFSSYPSTIKYVPDQFKTQEICDKAVDKCYFVFNFVSDQFKTEKMCNEVVSNDLFKLKYCHDRHKIQNTCDKAVDDCLASLKFVPDWFVLIKMIKKLLIALYAGGYILYFNEDSGGVVFSCNKMGIHSIDLYDINLDGSNYDEDDLETVIHNKLLT